MVTNCQGRVYMIKINSDAYLRLVAEKTNLEKKVENLEYFVKDALKGNVENITNDDIDLLKEQLHYMNGYLRILKYRIQRVYDSVQ